jgi:type IV secretory pathway VirJ component
MSTVLTQSGAMIAGIDDRRLVAAMEADPGHCVLPDGDLENLSHYIQAYYHLPTYLTPVLVGYSAGASLAYAVAAQAPRGVFAGVLTLGFSPDIDLTKPLCRGEGVHFRRARSGKELYLIPTRLDVPWINLTGDHDVVCPPGEARDFIARVPGARMVLLPKVDHTFAPSARWTAPLASAFATVAAGATASLPPPPQSLGDLPVIEVPATGPPGSGADDLFAVLLSGDGGWAGIDKELAHALSAQGIAVVGLDSLRYFWSARTPEGLARDLDRTVRYYAAHWHKRRALLLGYSQGADVLPFAVNRLPAGTRSLLTMTALIGLGRTAAFEFHLANWIGDAGGLPIKPEADKLDPRATLCIYGHDDADSLCGQLGPTHAHVIELPGGHHFGGDYAGLAQMILKQAGVGTGAAG